MYQSRTPKCWVEDEAPWLGESEPAMPILILHLHFGKIYCSQWGWGYRLAYLNFFIIRPKLLMGSIKSIFQFDISTTETTTKLWSGKALAVLDQAFSKMCFRNLLSWAEAFVSRFTSGFNFLPKTMDRNSLLKKWLSQHRLIWFEAAVVLETSDANTQNNGGIENA